MIKVVHIITRLILGGAQENTLLTVEGLQNLPNYQVFLISGPALGPEGELIKRARAHQVNLIIIPELRRNIHPLRDLISFIKLYRWLRRLKPAIVHTHSSKAGIIGRLAAHLSGIKVIIHTIHGLPFHPYQSGLANWFYITLERLAAHWSTHLISVADAMTRQALKAGVGKRTQFTTIRSGLEIKRFLAAKSGTEIRRLYNITDLEKVIGVVSRLAPLKGYEYLIEITPTIIREFPQTRFLFVGDGILRDKLRTEALRLGVLDHIIFTGLVEPERIPEFINAMDILVHPSLREGLARTLPEALALKKPVISFDIDGAREVVIDGETGLLVPPAEVNKLAEAILTFLREPERAKQMAENGYQIVSAQFPAGKMVKDIDSLYQKLLATNRGIC